MSIKKATISDIVSAAGVSKTTVSRYLNGHYEFMSGKTRERIEQVIKELDYHPNTAARTLKSKRTRMIGIILSGFGGQDFTQELSAICSVLDESGYTPIIFQGSDDPDKEKDALTSCISQNVDGIILHPASGDRSLYESFMTENDTPIVLVGRNIPNWQYDRVYIDQPAIVRKAIDRLLAQGYQNVALFTHATPSPMSNTVVRRTAYEEHMKSLGRPYRDLVFELDRDAAGIYLDLENTLDSFLRHSRKKRSAVIVSGTDLLVQLLELIQRRKFHIPDDFGLCGFNAWNWLELVNPEILIINRPLYQLGIESGKMILSRIEKGSMDDPQTIVLEASFYDQ